MLITNLAGVPVSGATIKLFDAVAFSAGNLDSWVGATVSNNNGEWVDSIDVSEGGSWVISVSKFNEFDPTHKELTT